MGLYHEGPVTEILHGVRVSHAPLVKDLGEMTENFRSKEGSRDLPVSPRDPEGLVQEIFIPVMAVFCSLMLFPDMDRATAGNCPEER